MSNSTEFGGTATPIGTTVMGSYLVLKDLISKIQGRCIKIQCCWTFQEAQQLNKQLNDLAAAGDLLMQILSGVTHKNKPKEKH